MKPIQKIIRIIISAFAIAVYYFEVAAEWVLNLNSRTEYVKKGKCNVCGKCCEAIAIYIPKPLRRFNNIIQKWHKLAYNFDLLSHEDGWNIYSCAFLREDGKCGNYRFRYRLCRNFPKPQYFGRPYIYRDCGFYFERRDGKVDFENILRKKLNK